MALASGRAEIVGNGLERKLEHARVAALGVFAQNPANLLDGEYVYDWDDLDSFTLAYVEAIRNGEVALYRRVLAPSMEDQVLEMERKRRDCGTDDECVAQHLAEIPFAITKYKITSNETTHGGGMPTTEVTLELGLMEGSVLKITRMSFTFALADDMSRIDAWEADKRAVETGNSLAKTLGLKNVEFFAGDLEKHTFSPDAAWDVVLLDPPRSGARAPLRDGRQAAGGRMRAPLDPSRAPLSSTRPVRRHARPGTRDARPQAIADGCVPRRRCPAPPAATTPHARTPPVSPGRARALNTRRPVRLR